MCFSFPGSMEWLLFQLLNINLAHYGTEAHSTGHWVPDLLITVAAGSFPTSLVNCRKRKELWFIRALTPHLSTKTSDLPNRTECSLGKDIIASYV